MRVDIENNRLVYNIFSFTADSIGKHLNVILDLSHVIDFLAWYFLREDSPGFTLVIQVVQA